MCNHDICLYCQQSSIKGVAACILTFVEDEWLIVLGRERFGQYAGEYNFAAGKIEQDDNGCYRKAIKRELVEEFKIDVSDDDTFDSIFVTTFFAGRTIMFVGIDNGIDVSVLNHYINLANSDYTIPLCEREMSDVQLFDSQCKVHKQSITCRVSSFVTSQIKTIYATLVDL